MDARARGVLQAYPPFGRVASSCGRTSSRRGPDGLDERAVPDAAAARDTIILPFNDLPALERALGGHEVALVLTEPALSNCNVVLPRPDFLAGVHAACQRHGTLLCLDEAHTFQFAYGGLTRAWKLAADFVVLGKGLGSGIAFGLYGMSEDLGRFMARNLDIDIGPNGLATGGTLYATAVAATAARVALEQFWTEAGCLRINELGRNLADGLQAAFDARDLPWRAFHLGPRSGYCLQATLPVDGNAAAASLESRFIDARRAFMANRGIWDAVASAGPQISHAHGRADVSRYLSVAAGFLDEISG